jgi:hypothetical protein
MYALQTTVAALILGKLVSGRQRPLFLILGPSMIGNCNEVSLQFQGKFHASD